MVEEARLERSEGGLAAKGEGWYVVNAQASRWFETEEFGRWCHFEGDVRFPELGINISVLEPGDVACMYHGESNQEDFLVLAGECVLLVEGQERPLKAWDFFHCPPWTEHVFAAGSKPCLILAVGGRKDPDDVTYPVSEVAARYGASVLEETTSGEEAYARFSQRIERRYQEGDLPDW
jgi:uncharacterized cupin superfamily protein